MILIAVGSGLLRLKRLSRFLAGGPSEWDWLAWTGYFISTSHGGSLPTNRGTDAALVSG